MDAQRRGTTMLVASILMATAVLMTTSATTAVESAVPTAHASTAAAAAGCRRGTMRPEVAVKCWVAVVEVPLCVYQIVAVFNGGSVFNVGKACCHAFVDLTDDCRIEVFQKSEFFPVIEKFCAAIGGGGGANTTNSFGGRAQSLVSA